MDLSMDIKQAKNGWILNYLGHDYLHKTIVCRKWSEVLKELDKHFGWYTLDGKHLKQNPY